MVRLHSSMKPRLSRLIGRVHFQRPKKEKVSWIHYETGFFYGHNKSRKVENYYVLVTYFFVSAAASI